MALLQLFQFMLPLCYGVTQRFISGLNQIVQCRCRIPRRTFINCNLSICVTFSVCVREFLCCLHDGIFLVVHRWECRDTWVRQEQVHGTLEKYPIPGDLVALLSLVMDLGLLWSPPDEPIFYLMCWRYLF